MCRKQPVCGGADHRGRGPKSKVSGLDFVQKFLGRRIEHHIWGELMTKPRHLALGVLPRMVDRDLPRLLQTKLATEEAKELRRAVRFQTRRSRIGLLIEH